MAKFLVIAVVLFYLGAFAITRADGVSFLDSNFAALFTIVGFLGAGGLMWFAHWMCSSVSRLSR